MKLRVKSSARRWKFIVSWVRACSSRLTKNASLENWPYASSTSKGRSPLPIVYKDVKLECGYRIDLLVESRIVVELKSIEAFAPIHRGHHPNLYTPLWMSPWASHQFQRNGTERWDQTIHHLTITKR